MATRKRDPRTPDARARSGLAVVERLIRIIQTGDTDDRVGAAVEAHFLLAEIRHIEHGLDVDSTRQRFRSAARRVLIEGFGIDEPTADAHTAEWDDPADDTRPDNESEL